MYFPYKNAYTGIPAEKLGQKRPFCRYSPLVNPAAARPPSPIALFDPGWLFLVAGIGILAATVLIPAGDELSAVRLQRDRALTVERHRADRIARYTEYLDALNREEPSLVMALAQSQLNQIPQGRSLIIEQPQPLIGGSAPASASVFGDLEPPPPKLPEAIPVNSILERLAGSDAYRPLLIAGGALCLLLGLLPRSSPAPT